VEFRLLGAVEVVVDGMPVDIGHARQQCVLASLALDANRMTSPDQLLDRVWGDNPPQRGRGAVHTYVSRLRRALLAAPGVGLDLRAGGYVLVADPMTIDIVQFRGLVESAARAPDDERRAALLTDALGLWRSEEAFGTLDTPWLNRVRESLHAERFAAELERNDVELRLGRHAQLVGPLTAATAANPWDERLAGQHILALYRSGRQSEALEAYQRFRRRLADELGTDPGAALQLLQQRILNADPALTAPAATRPPARPANVPRQLPAPSPSFLGRADELRELDAVAEGVPIVVIAGGGGMGKTWLALHWADRNLARFPDGQLYANLRGFDPTGEPVDPGVVVRGFLDALGVEPGRVPVDLDSQASLFRSTIAGRRMLVVLDNVRDTASAVPLLPGTADSTVMITSRRRPTGLVVSHGARVLALDVLPPDDARRVLLRGVGRAVDDGDQAAVTALLDHCSGLPLALGIAAARAALRPELPLSALVAELQAASGPLDAFDAGELTVNLRAVLATSVDALTPPAGEVFTLLGLGQGPDIGLDAVASLAAQPVTRTRALLAELATANLVVEQAPDRFRMHDLVRRYAVELAGAAGTADTAGAQERLLDHYLHTAHAAALLLSPHRDPLALGPARDGTVVADLADLDEAMAWFDAEHAVLLPTIRHAGEAGFHLHAHAIPWTLATYFDRRGHWQDWVAAQRIAVPAAASLGDWSAQAQAHRLLANAYSNLRAYNDALGHLESALALFEAHDNDAGRAHTQFDIALLFDRQSRPADALRHAVLSLRFYRATGSKVGEAVALNAVGWYHCELGEYQQAIENCRRALALTEAVGSLYGQANTWDSLGYAHHHLAEYSQAEECYGRAIALFREIGDSHAEALTLDHLGDTQDAAGGRDTARQTWRTALDLLDAVGHPEADQLRRKLAV